MSWRSLKGSKKVILLEIYHKNVNKSLSYRFLGSSCLLTSYFLADLQKSVTTRQQLDAQLTENNVVKEVTYGFFISKNIF